jgi:methionyl aminopeptidase
MVHLKTAEEIRLIRKSADLLGKTHGEIAKAVKPGIKTSSLDQLAESFIRDHGGKPSFKNYRGFPATLCISVNEVVVHGFPGKYELKEGDVIAVDCGVELEGFHSDSAYTYPLPGVDQDTLDLLQRTYDSLLLGIEAAKAGARTGDIGFAVQSYVESFGYGVVRELVGHGVGKSLHEEPEVPNFGKRGTGTKLVPGMVFAIEPMINRGTRKVVQERDGWTIRTQDRKPSAHFEHMVAIFESHTEVLTTHEYIEENYSIKWRNKSR